MKFLVLLLLVVGLVWWLRSQRRPSVPPVPPSSPEARAPQGEEMVACLQCGVHLPRSEALPGRGGLFCGEAHRSAYERQHPGS